MTLTLELPADLEARLEAEAARSGVPLEQYALGLLGGNRERGPLPSNGAELVDFWRREGVIGSRPDIADSLLHARAIRRQAERRCKD